MVNGSNYSNNQDNSNIQTRPLTEPKRRPIDELKAKAQKASPDKLVEGYKADENKVRMDLIPPEFIFATADILTFGAAKYADRNWEKGMKWGRPFGAAMRHLWSWWGGKTVTSKNFLFGDLDMETGRSHLWHAACCLAFLISYEARGIGTDDRFSS